MKQTFRQSMAWLHTWTGLVVGWVLFFVFVTGTAGYVDDEITRWMEPERPLAVAVASQTPEHLASIAVTRLAAETPVARYWQITLPHESRDPRGPVGMSVRWEDIPAPGHEFGRGGSASLDPETGATLTDPEPRDTWGGSGLYRMHYALHYIPYLTAYYIVGICTMLMLLAVVTGVITHKKIITDFFLFRPGKGQRSWLDAHNVVSVMCLPFFLMITYSGLVFFTSRYMPAPIDVVYGQSDAARDLYWAERFDDLPREYDPVAARPELLAQLIRKAQTEWGPDQVAGLYLEHRRGEPPFVELRRISGSREGGMQQAKLRFHAETGAPLPPYTPEGAATKTERALFNLHEGLFAGWALRWLYFISGLMGCAVIATGLVLWTVKRRGKHARGSGDAGLFDRHGLRLVEVLNAGTIPGLPFGIALFFMANRLLPLDLADRAAWELDMVFFGWGWALIYAAFRPLKRAWVELFWLAAAGYALVPVINALTSDRHLGVTLPAGDLVLAGVDLTMLGLAAAFAVIAIRLRHKWAVADEPRAEAASPEPGHAPEPGLQEVGS